MDASNRPSNCLTPLEFYCLNFSSPSNAIQRGHALSTGGEPSSVCLDHHQDHSKLPPLPREPTSGTTGNLPPPPQGTNLRNHRKPSSVCLDHHQDHLEPPHPPQGTNPRNHRESFSVPLDHHQNLPFPQGAEPLPPHPQGTNPRNHRKPYPSLLSNSLISTSPSPPPPQETTPQK